eukprot:TRINITY_DN1755_c4_g1_i1.p1 TRINITY_DN1755_c4_g1~~TRINITY_DN1755_c4_g1_i1.p1  ORF type:complete len:253 (+),score=88.10 TRINITY_DN1755_c4_g1_i1:72-830(+)
MLSRLVLGPSKNVIANNIRNNLIYSNSIHNNNLILGHGGPKAHIDSYDNNQSTPFEFTKENYKKCQVELAKYPKGYKRGALMELLKIAQKQHGWLPLAAMHKVAKIIGCEDMEVYEVATFYTMYQREKIGKNLVSVCATTPCMIRGSTGIYESIKNHLNIDYGETTPDGLFTLQEVECLGACVNAPMIQINDDYYEDLTPETAVDVIKTIQRGDKPKVGPQHGLRKVAAPAGGKTSLFEKPKPPPLRTDGEL